MWKRSEEDSTGRMEWLEKNVRSDQREASTSYSEREGVQGSSKNNNFVRVGDGGTDENRGSEDGGGIVEDVTMLRFSLGVTRMDKIRNE